MNAELTNALTNGMHAFCLFIYFGAAFWASRQGNDRFTRSVVGFFLLTYMLKVMGVYVHYEPETEAVKTVWVGIGIGIILLHYLIMHALRFPVSYRVAGMVFCLATALLAVMDQGFVFIAVQILGINLAAALWSRGWLRLGFFGVVGSNVFWIVARKGTEAWIGKELPTEYRYDNDLFHFMLIASTFVVYKAFARGDGHRPSLGRAPANGREIGRE